MPTVIALSHLFFKAPVKFKQGDAGKIYHLTPNMCTRQFVVNDLVTKNWERWLFSTENSHFQKVTARHYLGKKFQEAASNMRIFISFGKAQYQSLKLRTHDLSNGVVRSQGNLRLCIRMSYKR